MTNQTLMPCRVVHCMEEPFDVYIGRFHARFPDGSKWANPFKIGEDGTREDCIEKFGTWIRTQKHLMAALGELDGKTLGCWCKNKGHEKSCHGDALVDLVAERRKALGLPDIMAPIQNDDYLSQSAPKRVSQINFTIPRKQTLSFIVDSAKRHGIIFEIANGEVVASSSVGIIPLGVKSFVKNYQLQMKGFLNGCFQCNALGKMDRREVCCYETYFLGKAVRPKSVEARAIKTNCPLKNFQI